MYSYLLWLAVFCGLPLAFLWLRYFSILKNYGNIYLLAIVCASIVSVPWDLLEIRDGVWYFTEPHIVGVWLLGLPLEEWLFYVFVTLLFSSITVVVWSTYGAKEYVR